MYVYTPRQWDKKGVKGRGIFSVDPIVIKTSITSLAGTKPAFLDKSSCGLDFLGCLGFVFFIMIILVTSASLTWI